VDPVRVHAEPLQICLPGRGAGDDPQCIDQGVRVIRGVRWPAGSDRTRPGRQAHCGPTPTRSGTPSTPSTDSTSPTG
jgi:hypothetical protein